MLFSRRPDSFENVVATCLDELDAGAPLEDILAKYPQHVADLAPLLAVAAQMRTAPWPALSVHGRMQGRERMHAALAQYHSGFSRWHPSWGQAAMALAVAAVIVVVSLVLTRWERTIPDPQQLVAPAPTAITQQTVVAPDDAATATVTTEPSATSTLQIATATSTVTATASLDTKTTTASPSLIPQSSATAAPRATATWQPTQTAGPTATLVMNANSMSPTPRPTDEAGKPQPPPSGPPPSMPLVPTRNAPPTKASPVAGVTATTQPPAAAATQPPPAVTTEPPPASAPGPLPRR